MRRRFKKLLLKFVEPDTGINPEDIDWHNTKVFSYSNYGTIRLNVKGRDKDGVIDPEKYDEYLNRIIEMLKKDSSKRLRPFVRDVYKIRDIYREAEDPNYPDLIAIPSDEVLFRVSLSHRESEEELIKSNIDYDTPLYKEKEISGHIPEGMYIFHGPAFKSIGLGPDLVMMDIAPHILYLLKLPIPDYIQGRVNESIFRDEWLRENPLRMAKSRKFMIRSRVKVLRKRIKK
jgi:predicted AlkP superfamily phosphohydrolase/phosphomutase